MNPPQTTPRLIADVVTDSLELREAAARLPEIQPPSSVDLDEEPHKAETDEPLDALAEADA